ncbi:MAG: AbrB/MazE/SpoVT family DNA-binding domain-containing protein [Candidatus Heimdallarchaeota archaeon]|nr:AbrB/MazE/SpoVT family DNA-binding domain-containing protein [Candidatus Heimdallarchaeota archaeon]
MAIEVDVQIGKQGRVVIPSNVRRKYELEEGDWIKLVLVFETDKVYKDSTTTKAIEQY